MPENNQRLLQAIRVGNIGIFEHDHDSDCIHWSPELRGMYGWDTDEPATLPKIIAHVHPDDLARVGAAVSQAHDPTGDGSFDIEHRIVDRAGRVRWVQIRSQTQFDTVGGQRRASRTIGAVQEITARRMADERLRVLDTVLSSSAQAIAIADPRGMITFANEALRRLWGYPGGQKLVGRSLFDFWSVPDPDAALAQLRVGQTRSLDAPTTRADGSSFYLRVTAEAVCGEHGELKQVLCTFTDVTDQKRLEAQFLQAQKMDSIGRVAGGVAHDFNNMLAIISGGIELSLAVSAADHPGRPYLVEASDAVRSAAALTRQLLAFSRKESLAPRLLDLNDVLVRAGKMVARLLGHQIKLESQCGADVPSIWFDPVQLEQVILNLAINARDAMGHGGRLTFATSAISFPEAELEVRHYALLTVTDNGAGMTDEVRARLFEPFFTTKEAGKGTGLGLAMVYSAMQQNGGRIEVESELGCGTTFKLHLPAASVPSEAQAPAESGASRAPRLVR
jgi:two-component system, cell cycle sensor histidine kinase and response regulator CckA